MGNEEKIDQYIDRTGVTQDTEFMIAELNRLNAEFTKINGLRIGLNGVDQMGKVDQAAKQMDVYSKSVQQVKERMASMNGQSKEFTSQLLIQAKAEKELAQSSLASAKAQTESAKAKKLQTDASQKSAAALKNEQKIAQDAANDYKQLSLAYNEAALRAKNLVIRLGENHPVAVQAVNDAKALHDQLLKVDQSVGQSQRNVGNYSSALGVLSRSVRGFGGLGVILDKAFGIDPQVFEGIRETGRALRDLHHIKEGDVLITKEGTAATVANDAATKRSTVTQRIFNFVVGESTGVMKALRIALAATVVGAILIGLVALISNLKDISGASKRAEESIDSLGGISAESKEKLKSYGDTAQEIADGAIKDLSSEVDSLNESLGHTPSKVETAEAALKLLSDELEHQAEVIVGGGNLWERLVNIISLGTQGEKDFAKVSLKMSELTAEINKFKVATAEASIKEHQKSDQENIVANAQLIIDQNEKILKNDRTTENLKIALLRSSLQQRKIIIAANLEKELIDANGNALKEADARLKANRDRLSAERNNQDELQKIRDDYADRAAAADLKISQIELNSTKDFNKEITADISASRTERLIAAKKYLQASIELVEKEAEFEKNKRGITAKEVEAIEKEKLDKHQRLATESNKTISDIIEKTKPANLAPNPKDTKEFAAANEHILSALQKQIYNWDRLTEAEKAAKVEQKKFQEERAKLLGELANAVTDLGFSLLENSLEKEKNAIQDQIDLLEVKKQKDIEVANQTIVNAQDKANAIAVIEARAAAEKERLQRKQRQLDEQKARFDKAKAVADIIENTALLIVKTIAEFPGHLGITLAAIEGAIAAAQLAKVIATPIPKYKSGKNKDNYEGFAVVGDGGKSELHIREDGTVGITPDRPTLTWVNRKDIILPDANKAIEAGLNTIYSPGTENYFDAAQLSSEMRRGFSTLNSTIKNKKEIVFEKPSIMDRVERFKKANREYFKMNGL